MFTSSLSAIATIGQGPTAITTTFCGFCSPSITSLDQSVPTPIEVTFERLRPLVLPSLRKTHSSASCLILSISCRSRFPEYRLAHRVGLQWIPSSCRITDPVIVQGENVLVEEADIYLEEQNINGPLFYPRVSNN